MRLCRTRELSLQTLQRLNFSAIHQELSAPLSSFSFLFPRRSRIFGREMRSGALSFNRDPARSDEIFLCSVDAKFREKTNFHAAVNEVRWSIVSPREAICGNGNRVVLISLDSLRPVLSLTGRGRYGFATHWIIYYSILRNEKSRVPIVSVLFQR